MTNGAAWILKLLHSDMNARLSVRASLFYSHSSRSTAATAIFYRKQ